MKRKIERLETIRRKRDEQLKRERKIAAKNAKRRGIQPPNRDDWA